MAPGVPSIIRWGRLGFYVPIRSRDRNSPELSTGDMGEEVARLRLLVLLGSVKVTGMFPELSIGRVGEKVAHLRLFAYFSLV